MRFRAQQRPTALSSLRSQPIFRALAWLFMLASPSLAFAATTTTLSITSTAGPITTVPAQTSITLTAAVLNGASPVTTGQINFCDASAVSCTDIHLLGTAQLTSAGTAVLRFAPAIGTHSYKAVFLGTTGTPGSASAVSALQVTAVSPFPSTTTLVSSGSAGSYKLTGTVLGAAGLPSPSGSLSFLDITSGNATVATAELVPSLALSNSSNLTVGPAPGPATAGDFDGDGRSDLAVITNDGASGGAVAVYLGNGDGTFTAGSIITVSAGEPISLITGDFNGDGKLDIVVAYEDVNDDEGLLVLLGNGNGTFNPGETYPNVANLLYAGAVSGYMPAVADLNGDGILDIALPDPGGQDIAILLGNGDGTFTAGTKVSTGLSITPIWVALGDFNADGKQDLAVLEESGPLVAIFTGNGDGTFSAPTNVNIAGEGYNTQDIVVGDFNGDGKADIAFPSTDTSNPRFTDPDITVIDVLLGNGDGTFNLTRGAVTPVFEFGSTLRGDFNGDGIADIALSRVIFLGKGDGTFSVSSPANLPSGGYPTAGDFNGDGASDLASVSSTAVVVDLAQQTATATATNISLIGTGVHQVEASFPGDATYTASTSSTVGLSTVAATTLTLTANPSTTILGQPVTLTATLSPYTASGHSTDGESISFTQNGSTLGTAVLAGGVAVLNTTNLTSGTDLLEAAYQSDNTLASSSSTVSYFVSIQPSITFAVPDHTYGDAPFPIAATSNSTGTLTYSIVSGPATIAGSTVTINGAGAVVAQVSQVAAGAYSAITQTASWTANQAPLTVTANSAARVYGAPNPAFTAVVTGAVRGDTFTETFSTTATAASIVGTYAVMPSITGANLADYAVQTNNSNLTVTQAGTATTFALSNQNTTLTASVATLTTGAPTGSVGFYEGQTLVGTGTLSNGVASYTAGALPSGDVVVSAEYSGDANFTQSASPPILVLAAAPANPSLTVAQAGTVTDTISLSSASGFTGAVQLSCEGLPANTTCSFAPASVTFTGSGAPVSVGLTIHTGVTSEALLLESRPEERGNPGGLLAISLWAPGFFATALAGFKRRPGSGARNRVVLMLMFACLALTLCGCGGGSSSSSGSTPVSAQTPTGTTTVQVIIAGSSGLSQTVGLNLTVQ